MVPCSLSLGGIGIERAKAFLQRTEPNSHQSCDWESDMPPRWRALCKGRGGHSPASCYTAAPLDVSPCSRMEKLGDEIAAVFTHSHVVSLVVSFQPSRSSLFTLSSNPSGSRGVIIPFVAVYETIFWSKTDLNCLCLCRISFRFGHSFSSSNSPECSGLPAGTAWSARGDL